jgi:hypothetical protein
VPRQTCDVTRTSSGFNPKDVLHFIVLPGSPAEKFLAKYKDPNRRFYLLRDFTWEAYLYDHDDGDKQEWLIYDISPIIG